MPYLVKMDLTTQITHKSYYFIEGLVQGSGNSSLGFINCFLSSQEEQFSVSEVYSLRYNVPSSVCVFCASFGLHF